MLEPFMLRAALGGLALALCAAPLGCFILWRRMAYAGDTLAHSALLGAAVGVILGIDVRLSVLLVCLLLAAILALLENLRRLPPDSILGIFAHGSMALGLVLISQFTNTRIDLMALLFGDILALGWSDVWIAISTSTGLLVLTAWLWRPMLSTVISPDLAALAGVPVRAVRLAFGLMTAIAVALGIQAVGLVLVVALLVIPAAAARPISRSPEKMGFLAMILGGLSVLGGLVASWYLDWPAGPAIVLVAALLVPTMALLAHLQPER